MARIRTIKPEFFTDDTVGECSPSARLLFVGTWVFADDHGNLDRSARQLKAQVFPHDSIDCEPLIRELLEVGLLIEYEVDGKKYLHIKGFRAHQKIDKPSKPRVPLYEPSPSPRRVFDEPSLSPRSGREGKGKERKGKEHTERARDDHQEFERVKAAYPRFAGRQDWINAELACHNRIEQDAQTWDDLVAAAERYARYCEAVGRTGTNFVMTPGKFFSAADRPWLQPWDIPEPPKRPARSNGTSHAEVMAALDAAVDPNSEDFEP